MLELYSYRSLFRQAGVVFGRWMDLGSLGRDAVSTLWPFLVDGKHELNHNVASMSTLTSVY